MLKLYNTHYKLTKKHFYAILYYFIHENYFWKIQRQNTYKHQKNLPVRPTTDMAKEALFNILNNHFNFQDLKILDLFGWNWKQ